MFIEGSINVGRRWIEYICCFLVAEDLELDIIVPSKEQLVTT